MKYVIMGLFISLVACADPKYVASDYGVGQNQHQGATCQITFKNSGVCVDWEWEKVPSESESGEFYFKTYKLNEADGSMILLDQELVPYVVLWMPSMNHGSSPVTTSRDSDGVYRAKNVFFVMPGKWEIKFQLRKDNQVIDEAISTIII